MSGKIYDLRDGYVPEAYRVGGEQGGQAAPGAGYGTPGAPLDPGQWVLGSNGYPANIPPPPGGWPTGPADPAFELASRAVGVAGGAAGSGVGTAAGGAAAPGAQVGPASGLAGATAGVVVPGAAVAPGAVLGPVGAPEWGKAAAKRPRGAPMKYPFNDLPVDGTFKVLAGPDQPAWRSFQIYCSRKGTELGRRFLCHRHGDGTFEVWRQR